MIVTVKANQTLTDLAIQCYGTMDGIWKILADNPGLQFDDTLCKTGVAESEHLPLQGYTDISMPLMPGQTILYEPLWTGRDTYMLKKLKGAVLATGYSLL